MTSDELMHTLEDAALETAFMAKFGIARGTMTEREIAETMMKVPASHIDRKLARLQVQMDWLRGWKVR